MPQTIKLEQTSTGYKYGSVTLERHAVKQKGWVIKKDGKVIDRVNSLKNFKERVKKCPNPYT